MSLILIISTYSYTNGEGQLNSFNDQNRLLTNFSFKTGHLRISLSKADVVTLK